jgi:hypothetical protein
MNRSDNSVSSSDDDTSHSDDSSVSSSSSDDDTSHSDVSSDDSDDSSSDDSNSDVDFSGSSSSSSSSSSADDGDDEDEESSSEPAGILWIFIIEGDSEPESSPLPPQHEVLSPAQPPEEGGDVCPVCLCDLGEVDQVVRIKACGHLYCEPCIVKWLYESRSKLCAVCKRDVRGSVKRVREDDPDADADQDSRPESSVRRIV